MNAKAQCTDLDHRVPDRVRPLSRRDDLLRLASGIVRNAFTTETHESIAEATHAHRSHVTRWTHDYERLTPNLLHILAAASNPHGAQFARNVVDELQRTIRPTRDGMSDGERLARLTVELTDVARKYAVVMADGFRSGPETREIVRELLEAKSAIDAALAEFGAEMREDG